MTIILEIKNLSIEYKIIKDSANTVVKAVKDVSLQLNHGEIYALAGESGCGKSVTSNAIMGLVPQPPGKVTARKIEFKGKDLKHYTRKQFREIQGMDISMIFQDPMTALNPIMTVGEQLSEVVLTHEKVSKAEAKQRVIDLLKIVGVKEDRYDNYPHEFSGGQKQRVVIAMSLLCNPKLLIADEPTTALDVTIQAQVLEIINKLREQYKMSMILITHDLGVVAETCDKVAIMYAGQIVEQGSIVEVYDNPKHPYTKGLLESIPRIDEDKERLYMIDGVVPSPQNLPEGCAFAPRCPDCMEICKKSRPALVESEGRMLRCFLYHSVCEGEQK